MKTIKKIGRRKSDVGKVRPGKPTVPIVGTPSTQRFHSELSERMDRITWALLLLSNMLRGSADVNGVQVAMAVPEDVLNRVEGLLVYQKK